jgi:hypothetical protein
MKVNLTYDFATKRFVITEDNVRYEIPFSVIYEKGRKLIYYNNNSSTRVKDWFEKLEENYKQLISIKTARDSA